MQRFAASMLHARPANRTTMPLWSMVLALACALVVLGLPDPAPGPDDEDAMDWEEPDEDDVMMRRVQLI